MTALERVTGDDYLGDLTSAPIDEVRVKRAECQSVETGLSYLRRLIQGRLDLVATEIERRHDGSPGSSLADLIARLPEVLSEHSRAPGIGRMPQTLGTGEVDPELEAAVDGVLAGRPIDELADDQLAEAVEALSELEQRVSAHRKVLFDRLDALQAEIGRRYRTGEASVESLLS